MRAPPPVAYPSALTRAWRGLLALLAGASTASALAGLLPHLAAGFGDASADGALADPVLGPCLALAAGAVAAGVVWCGWQRGPERTLAWDGQDWVLGGDGRADQRGDVALMLDLGAWMLVRFRSSPAPGAAVPGRSVTGRGIAPRPVAWLPLAAGPDAARWAALRGALWNWRAAHAEPRP